MHWMLFWSQTIESQVFGPEVLKDAEKQVQMIRENLKVTPRQKSYAKKEGIFHLKLVILYTLRFPLWEAPEGLRSRES
jgi:hypothetical protein